MEIIDNLDKSSFNKVYEKKAQMYRAEETSESSLQSYASGALTSRNCFTSCLGKQGSLRQHMFNL